MLEFILNPIFGPLLGLEHPWGILIIAFAATLLVTLIYKFATDQGAMKSIKQEVKELQTKIKDFKDDPAKVMDIQKDAMEKQLQLMKHSFKPMILTFIPLILIFGWLNANMLYEPIIPGEMFNTDIEFIEGSGGEVTLSVPQGIELADDSTKEIIDKKVSWRLKGQEGEYSLEYKYNDASYTKDVLITPDFGYKDPIKRFKKNVVQSISISHEKIIVLNLFGWKLGWLGSYIIFSIIFSLILRKLMKVE